MTGTPPSARAALYRLYDANDRLLYVGMTSDPKKRWAAHAVRKPWWPEVATRDVEWFADRKAAQEAEAAAIRGESPLYNHQHNDVSTPLIALLPAVDDEPLRPTLRRVDQDDRPAAQRVAADLRALIMSGDAPLGSRLPTNGEFVERYRISNVTVQRALAILKDEGLVVGRSGSGVYVTSPTPPGFGAAEAHRKQVLDCGEVKAPHQIAEALRLTESESVLCERSVIDVDDWPVRLIATYRKGKTAEANRGRTVDRVSVRQPTTAELVALNLSQDVPVLVTTRVFQGDSGLPLGVDVIVEPGNLCQREYGAFEATAPSAQTETETVALRSLLARVLHLLADDDELFNNGVFRAIELLSANGPGRNDPRMCGRGGEE